MRAGFLAALLLIVAAPAMAGPREDVLYGISRCGGISDDRTWLNCVYGAVQPMRQQLGLPPAPVAQTALVPPAIPGMAAPAIGASMPARPAKKPSFWSKMWAEGADPIVTDVIMSDYRFDRRGAFTVTLSNGQVWKEDPREKPLAGWKDKPEHYVVTIEPEDDGFRMRIAGDNNSYRVQRAS